MLLWQKRCAVLMLCGLLLLTMLIVAMTLWAMCALYYSDLQSYPLRACLAGLFGLATVCAFALLPGRLRTLVFFLAAVTLVAVWWATISPSNNRDWQADVAVLPRATIQGDQVTLHNIRNFTYRTETDFTPGYYDKTFELDRLSSVDLIAVYWMGDAIAHIMLSFGFGGIGLRGIFH